MAEAVKSELQGFLAKHAVRNQRLIIGVSGGADSLALLHSLRALSRTFGLQLHAAHLNHQLRGADSEGDARYVEELAAAWGVPATIESRDVLAYAAAHKLSVEEAARTVRYSFLEQVAKREGAQAVVVAHHADDQVETILMHFLRGAGTAGLRGMQPDSQYPFRPPVRLLRPLLGVWRTEIESYCMAQGITARQDASNADTGLLRNRLRHEVLPLLEQTNPNLRSTLLRSARVIADDYDYISQRARGAWRRMTLEQHCGNVAFALGGWRTLQPSLKRTLIRMAVMRLRPDLRQLDAQHVEDAMRVADEGHAGAQATLPSGLWLFRDYEAIVIGEALTEPDLPRATEQAIRLAIPGRTKLPADWQLEAKVFDRPQLPADALDGSDRLEAFFDSDKAGSDLWVRARKPRDEFRPFGLGGHGKPLRRYMTDAGIPAAWRAQTPLVVAGSEVLWVGGWRIAERVKIDEQTTHVLSLRFSKLES